MHWSLLRSSPTLKGEWELLPLRPSFPSKLSLNFHPCSCKWLNVLFFRVASLCWPAHFIFLLHRSCISSHAELGLVVEPISLCIHEMFSLRESVWLCATLGISVKGLHLQCLWCSQLFAPFERGLGVGGGGVHTAARDDQQPVEPAVTARARIMSLLNLRRYRWPQKKENLTGRELPFKLVLWYELCQWNDSSLVTEKGDDSLLVVCEPERWNVSHLYCRRLAFSSFNTCALWAGNYHKQGQYIAATAILLELFISFRLLMWELNTAV